VEEDDAILTRRALPARTRLAVQHRRLAKLLLDGLMEGMHAELSDLEREAQAPAQKGSKRVGAGYSTSPERQREEAKRRAKEQRRQQVRQQREKRLEERSAQRSL
jgi:hypothetical protein